MRKKTTIWLIVAIILILIGCIIFGGVMTMLNWDFSKLSTDKYVTNEHMISEEYKNISIITGTADIVFVASENATHSITCHEQQNTKHSVSVKDDTLVIELLDTRKWYEYIGIHFGSPKITVSIPAGEYVALSVKGSTGNVDIPEQFRFTTIDITESTGNITNYASASAIQAKTSTGKICLQNVTSQRIVLSVSTGKTILANVKCDSLISHGSTGNIDLKNVITAEKLFIKRSTGNVTLDSCDAAEIYIETSTGNVSGTVLSDKIFVAKTSTGHVDVPQTASGGTCEVSTSTGNIKIYVK